MHPHPTHHQSQLQTPILDKLKSFKTIVSGAFSQKLWNPSTSRRQILSILQDKNNNPNPQSHSPSKTTKHPQQSSIRKALHNLAQALNSNDMEKDTYQRQIKQKRIKQLELDYIRNRKDLGKQFKVQGKSKNIIQELKKRGRYTSLMQKAIPMHSHKIQQAKQQQKINEQLESIPVRIFKSKDANNIFQSFLQRNNEWCHKQRAKQIKQIGIQLSQQEVKPQYRVLSSNKQRVNRKRAQQKRLNILRQQLQKHPFQPNMNKDKTGNMIRYYSEADRLFTK